MQAEAVYQGLSAEVYDLWFGSEPFEDQAFFERRIRSAGGAALEVACGTGRLLVPFLRDGIAVDGADISSSMLEICREKAERLGLSPRLYEQAMERLSVDRRYRTIYIPYCSFQMLGSRSDALEALRRFRDHLEPGGQVLISIFLPWNDVADDRRWWLKRTGTLADGSTVLMHEAVVPDRIARAQTDYYKYEVYSREGRLLQTELRMVRFLWYFRDDIEAMFRETGFRDVEVFGEYTDRASRDDDEVWVARAVRP